MKQRAYLDLDLSIDPVGALGGQGERYVARVLESPSGQASIEFQFPLTSMELAQFIVAIGPPRVSSRRLVPSAGPRTVAPATDVKEYGRRLNDAVFAGEVNTVFRVSLDRARGEGKGLRIRLRLANAPALDGVPWEYLYNSALDRFLAVSQETPIVRFLESAVSPTTLMVEPPMRVLVMVSSPSDEPPLEVEREIQLLRATTADLVASGLLELVFLEDATLAALQHQLYDRFHVFHFVGHGAFDSVAREGVLAFEDAQGRSHRVTGSQVGTLLHDATDLQLAVLNACEGARTSGQDAFSGVGQSLVRQGLPAVVAMQLEISDQAALAFAHEFYFALSRGQAVDAAMSEARKAIYVSETQAEWGTPVLLRSAAEQPFELVTQMAAPRPEARWEALYTAAEDAIAAGAATTAMPILERLATEKPDYQNTTQLLERMRDQEAAGTGGTGGTDGTDGADGADGTDIPDGSGAGHLPRIVSTAHRGPLSDLADEPPIAQGGTGPGSGSGGPGGWSGPGGLGSSGGSGGSGSSGGAGSSGRRSGTGDVRVRVRAFAAGIALVLLGAIGTYVLWPKGSTGPPVKAVQTTPVVVTGTTGPTTPATKSTTPTPPPPRAAATVHATFSPRGQVIDGQVDDWKGLTAWPATNQIAPQPGAATDLSARWWLAWNRDALFVYTVVADPTVTPVGPVPSAAWNGDSVSFEFGPDPSGLASDAKLRSTDLHLILGVGEGGRVVAAVNPARGAVIAAGGLAPDVRATTWVVKGGYAIEAAIPWSVLHAQPAAGATFAMNLDASDAFADGPKAGKLRVMVSSNPARALGQARPGLWDRMVLDGANG